MAPVKLYVYDLSQGMARAFSGLIGNQIDGIWHTSVVVYDSEWYFGKGVFSDPPGTTIYGKPLKIIDMGETEVPKEIFLEYIEELRESYTADKYHLLDKNCNTFSNGLCDFLIGRNIPDHITNLPAEFLSTQMGRQLRPYIESYFGPRKIVHFAADAVLVSAVLAGIKRSTGLSVATNNIENQELRKAVNKFLNVGEWVVDQSILIMSSSAYFERKR
ncbi:16086_t:CDS:2 [Funneliformis geosporum]|uniref:17877_t:CDS:1 n=1 Tax=Funneliformis geosporum TaxID=1117311 RepID=A0A9W4SJM7_9GLOM|nr:16086_t:CDS:2 [Funneliformis geosporum]CAI2171948.1 17877_t:CDS:2 [Funneliformis geosporum]